MENNNYQQAQYQQPVSQTPQYQPVQIQPVQIQPAVDHAYLELANQFLKTSIIAGAISSLPVASFIALSMATKNRKKILDYINQGGYHTVRIKTCSAVSRAAKYSAVGFSIFWGVYLTVGIIYYAIMLIVFLAALASGNI